MGGELIPPAIHSPEQCNVLFETDFSSKTLKAQGLGTLKALGRPVPSRPVPSRPVPSKRSLKNKVFENKVFEEKRYVKKQGGREPPW